MNKTALYIVIAIIIAGGIGFWGGTAYGKNQPRTFTFGNGQCGQFGPNMMAGGRGGNGNRGGLNGGFLGGEVLSKDDKSITLKLPNNAGTRIVFTSGSTQVAKSVSGSLTDVTVGEQVSINGTPNSDGSITASVIQIRPASSTLPVR